MAGSLIKIDEEIVTSAVASVTLTGIDSTYDVYMVKYNNAIPNTDSSGFRFRVTVSGTADTTANYDTANKQLASDTTFVNNYGTNATEFGIVSLGTAGNESSNGIIYLFNFNNASEYSFVTYETIDRNTNGALRGSQGGGVHTVAQSCDGLEFFFSNSSDFASGSVFTLYGLKK